MTGEKTIVNKKKILLKYPKIFFNNNYFVPIVDNI